MDREAYLHILTKQHRKTATEYMELQREYGKKKATIRKMVAANIKKIMDIKKSVGIEMAEILLVSEHECYASDYARMLELESLLRGYEEVLNAIKSEQIKEQSIMKFYGEHDGYGKETCKQRGKER